MAASKKKKDVITLECSECRRKNYTYIRGKKAQRKKLEIKKYCKWCNKHTLHKQAK